MELHEMLKLLRAHGGNPTAIAQSLLPVSCERLSVACSGCTRLPLPRRRRRKLKSKNSSDNQHEAKHPQDFA
jgi:hypothetical protein